MVPSQVFEIVIRRHQAAVRRFLTGLTNGDTMLADDLAQETFIKAFYAWDTFAALSAPKTWLMRIAYTTFVDYTRSHHVTDELEQAEWVTSVGNSRSTDIQYDVQAALQQLSEQERICVQLELIEDQSIRQIVAITGLNENTVKSHLRRGKDKLKTFLINNGYDR